MLTNIQVSGDKLKVVELLVRAMNATDSGPKFKTDLELQKQFKAETLHSAMVGFANIGLTIPQKCNMILFQRMLAQAFAKTCVATSEIESTR